MAIPYPADPYLLSLGRAAYAVAYFEWLILGDLSQIAGLPDEASVTRLAGRTTGQIAKTLRNASASVDQADDAAWLYAAAEHLAAISSARNSILHARPATVERVQCLFRWDVSRDETFPISEEHIDDFVRDVEERIAEMSQRRPKNSK